MFIDLYCANINPGIGKTFSFAHYIDVNQILLKNPSTYSNSKNSKNND